MSYAECGRQFVKSHPAAMKRQERTGTRRSALLAVVTNQFEREDLESHATNS